MSQPLLSAHMILKSGVKHDYPFREVVLSCLPVADEVLICCPPEDDDGTRDACEELAREHRQVRVLLRDWWRNTETPFPPNEHSGAGECLSIATNWMIPHCRGRYHLAIQADEVLHEDDYDALLSIVREDYWPFVELERLNFWGSFDVYNGNRSRWPCSVVRLAKTACFPDIRSYGDATHLGIVDRGKPRLYERLDARDRVALWHYTYSRAVPILTARHREMVEMYYHPGCEYDPRFKAAEVTGVMDRRATVPEEEDVPIPGPHPAVVQPWIEARRAAVEAGFR